MSRQKKEVIIICLMIFATLLIGCGKREEKDDNTIVRAQVDSVINKDENVEDEKEQEREVIVDEPVKFDCMDEIKEASPDSGLIQIDDIIIQYGAKFSEIADAIEKSESTYEAEEYNVSSFVPAGETLGIRFYKNSKQYFIIRVLNLESETIEL